MSSQAEQYFSQKNEAMLQRVLYTDICRRTGGDLTEKQADRLIKTVKHYMHEVHRVKGDSAVNVLNAEVLKVVLPDYMMYMERSALNSRQVVNDIELGPSDSAVVGAIEDTRQLDVGVAFSQLQASRQTVKAPVPEMQDFRLSLKDDPPVSMDMFERMKNDRSAEATRVMEANSAIANATGQQSFATATDSYVRNKRRAEEQSEVAFAELERKQLEARASSSSQLPIPPDMRSVFLGDRQNLDRTLNRPSNGPSGLDAPASRQQMIITREPDTMEYKENELNLFVYSGDRDWISNSTETRYNFSVSFDPSNLPTGLRLSPTSTVKFRNIVRIEMVKAIMPGESVDSLVTRSYNGSSFTYSSPYNFNILSFPYIQVRIPELDTNTYGTNLGLNGSFGVLQYDANWIYDTNNANARGYFAMIPKFLKCQKVYSPTPLATLQKLSFRMERPDGSLVSATPDTLDISHIYSSKEIAASASLPYGYDSAVENGTSAAYYFINTGSYFNQLTVTKGDRIIIKNLAWSVAAAGSAVSQLQDFTNYIQADSGLIVVDVGFASSFNAFTVGANAQGYCNYIVVRGKFTDPTTGSTTTALLGNIADSSSPGSLTSNTLSLFLNTNRTLTGRLLNQSHQVQITMRIITREMDATSVLRPDNL